MECHHRRFLHRWIARSTRRLQVDAKRRDIMCYSAGRHRGCLNWLQPHDGRQHKARCAPTTTSRRGCTIWRRRHGCGRVKRFRFTIYTSSERTVIRPRAGSDMSDVWASGVFGMFGIYRRQVSAAGGVHTLLSFVLYLYHIRDTTCTTSGGVSRRKLECAEFRRYDTSQCSSAIAHPIY